MQPRNISAAARLDTLSVGRVGAQLRGIAGGGGGAWHGHSGRSNNRDRLRSSELTPTPRLWWRTGIRVREDAGRCLSVACPSATQSASQAAKMLLANLGNIGDSILGRYPHRPKTHLRRRNRGGAARARGGRRRAVSVAHKTRGGRNTFPLRLVSRQKVNVISHHPIPHRALELPQRALYCGGEKHIHE